CPVAFSTKPREGLTTTFTTVVAPASLTVSARTGVAPAQIAAARATQRIVFMLSPEDLVCPDGTAHPRRPVRASQRKGVVPRRYGNAGSSSVGNYSEMLKDQA